ncbi:MAG: protein BatD [Proteobacteria bacterium]|nr:protein BatD [Pseudomonadota bacterium]
MVKTYRKNNTVVLSLLYTLLLLSVFFSTVAQAAADITVSTSRNPVSLDDSFHLIYKVNSGFFGNGVDDDPDFSPIDKDFDILSSSQSVNSSYINGTWKKTNVWQLALIAKQVGKFTVPAINFGKDISPAIQITVTNSTSPNSVSPKDQATIPAKIFLESSIDKKSGWVQSQFIYIIRLLRTVSIASASLSEPVSNDPDAIIEKLSEENYKTTRNGISYDVFERRYAIFPQKSGQLKINPVTFEGRVNPTQARTIFDQFRMSGQLKRLRSLAVETNVKAAPASINLQDWLPAGELQLIEEWSDDIQDIKTGEPVTRTITIAALGLTAVQLPDLSFKEIDGLKQYPDKPVTENRPEKSGITGLKQIKVALIPSTPGSYTLPEIKLQWWNTKTNKKETAVIPEKTLIAVGGADTNNSITEQPLISSTHDEKLIADNETPTSLASIADSDTYWKWLALAFASAWLVTMILLLKKSKTKIPEKKAAKGTASISTKAAASAVEKHAGSNDAKKTRTALNEWAKVAYQNDQINNLTQISENCSPHLAQLIRQLNQSLYSQQHQTWDGKEFLAAFRSEPPADGKSINSSSLKPLYNN